jgi:hypothetical protein
MTKYIWTYGWRSPITFHFTGNAVLIWQLGFYVKRSTAIIEFFTKDLGVKPSQLICCWIVAWICSFSWQWSAENRASRRTRIVVLILKLTSFMIEKKTKKQYYRLQIAGLQYRNAFRNEVFIFIYISLNSIIQRQHIWL